MIKRLFLSIFILSLIGCGISEADYATLKKENERLKEELSQVNKRLEELDYLAGHSQVSLANTELKKVESAINGQTYTIKVHLPRTYNEGNQRYPVLYVTDAETNFGGVSYIVQRLIKDELIPPLIVVGIAYNTSYDGFYELRSRDLTPTKVRSLRPGGRPASETGGSPKFARFLEEELFPFVAENYRVVEGDRAYYGHSYGGLFGSTSLLDHAQLFNRYIILGPSLWFDEELLLRRLPGMDLTIQPGTRAYFGSGELEYRIDDQQEQFVQMLKDKSIAELSVKSEVFENETHRTIFGVGFTNGLRYIYEK